MAIKKVKKQITMAYLMEKLLDLDLPQEKHTTIEVFLNFAYLIGKYGEGGGKK